MGLFCAPAEKALASSDIRTVHSGHSGAQWWCWGTVVVMGHSGGDGAQWWCWGAQDKKGHHQTST